MLELNKYSAIPWWETLTKLILIRVIHHHSSMHLNEIYLKPPPRLRGGGWGWGSYISLNREPL